MKKLNQNQAIAVFVALAILIIFPLLSAQFSIVDSILGNDSSSDSVILDKDAVPQDIISQDIIVGAGAMAVPGKTLLVHYTGQLDDGTVFDTSRDKEPFMFILGAGQVIEGWDRGLEGMMVGGRRILIIPPEFGYGSGGIGPIPGDAILIFEVELVEVK